MARFHGRIGYEEVVETSPGVYTPMIVERDYFGDDIVRMSKWEAGENLNDDINVQNEISIVADAYAYQNFQNIRYVEYMGAKWKVKSIKVIRPRLTLSIGGVYNG